MDFMGKKLEDIVVTLPYEDGTSMEYAIAAQHFSNQLSGK